MCIVHSFPFELLQFPSMPRAPRHWVPAMPHSASLSILSKASNCDCGYKPVFSHSVSVQDTMQYQTLAFYTVFPNTATKGHKPVFLPLHTRNNPSHKKSIPHPDFLVISFHIQFLRHLMPSPEMCMYSTIAYSSTGHLSYPRSLLKVPCVLSNCTSLRLRVS